MRTTWALDWEKTGTFTDLAAAERDGHDSAKWRTLYANTGHEGRRIVKECNWYISRSEKQCPARMSFLLRAESEEVRGVVPDNFLHSKIEI